ncbi:hypothetical protein DENSPDRAFT_788874, partial [Dentipellis sp. KUC8613]
MSGYLRQEFRELEMLNYITTLRFKGQLKPGVAGNTRSSLIKSFQKVYDSYCPDNIPETLKWSPEDPILIGEEDDESFVWQKVEVNNPAAKPNAKRKRKDKDDDDDDDLNLVLKNDIIPDIKPPKKKRKTREVNLSDKVRGMTWNENTWSCAYDSLLTMLSHSYLTSTRKWNEKVANANQLLDEVTAFW